MKAKASPFDVLAPQRMKQLPATRSITVVVQGTKVDSVLQVERLLVDADREDDQSIAEARRLAAKLRKSKRAAREKVLRQTGEVQAYQKAWRAANNDKVKAARKRWVQANLDKAAAITRRYYANHRDEVRARARERYHARKAAAQAEVQS